MTAAPDEVVIVDGGSADGTVEVLRSFTRRLPLRILVEPGCSISAGRNRGVEVASCDLIAVTDAGVRLASSWLEEIVAPLILGEAEVTVLSLRIHARSSSRAWEPTTLPQVGEIDPDRFLPSSRSVAFTKPTWEHVGGYPEWLDYCEDLVFD